MTTGILYLYDLAALTVTMISVELTL